MTSTLTAEPLTGWHFRGRTLHARRECLSAGCRTKEVTLASVDYGDWVPCPRCGAVLVWAAEAASGEPKTLTVLTTYPVDASTERWMAARKPQEVAFLTELAASAGAEVVTVAGGKFPVTALAVDAGTEIARRCGEMFQLIAVTGATAGEATPARLRLFLTLVGDGDTGYGRVQQLWAVSGDCG